MWPSGPPGYAVVLLQYKSTPGKKVNVVGWMVQLPDDPEHPDIFQLNNPDKGRQQAQRGHPLLLNVHFETVGTFEAFALGSDAHWVPSKVHKSCLEDGGVC